MEALDRTEACRLQIEKDGQIVKDRFGQQKPHPLLAVERDARAAFVVCLKNLQLDIEPPPSKNAKGY